MIDREAETFNRNCVIPIDPATGEPLLLQTWWADDPWRVCVTSLLLVATQRVQVEAILNDFYDAFPTPRALLAGNIVNVMRTVHTLGLGVQRATRLTLFTDDFLDGVPVAECYGVGPYVYDAYRLVHLKQRNVWPEDTILQRYAEWLRGTT